MCLKLSLWNRFIMLWEYCSDLEHLTSTFTIGRRNYWCMYIQKSSCLEKLMSCKCQAVSNSSNSSYCVCSWPKMSQLSQSFQLWSSSHGIAAVAVSTYCGSMLIIIINLKFKYLSFSWWFNQSSLEHKRCSNNCFSNIIKSFHFTINHNLYIVETTSIVEFNETKLLLWSCALCQPPILISCPMNSSWLWNSLAILTLPP